MAVSLPTLGHYQGDSHTQPMLCSGFLHFCPEGHQEVWSLSLAKCLVGFEWGTFWFWLQCLSPIGHADIELYWIVEKFCVTWKAISQWGRSQKWEDGKFLKSLYIIGRVVLTPLSYDETSILPTLPFFKFCPED